MIYNKILITFIALLILNLVRAGDEEESTETPEIILTPGPITSEYKKKDLDVSYDSSSITIECTGNTCNSASEGVIINEGNVTISSAGTYILQGTLQGQVYISATKEDYIHLVLNNMSVTSSKGPAIHEIECDKLVITTVGENSLSDTASVDDIDIVSDTNITTSDDDQKNDNDDDDDDENE